MGNITESRVEEIYNAYYEKLDSPESERVASAGKEFDKRLDEYLAVVSEDAFKEGIRFTAEVLGFEHKNN